MTMIVACKFNSASDWVMGATNSSNELGFRFGCIAGGLLSATVGAAADTPVTGSTDIRTVPGVGALRYLGAGQTMSLFWKPLDGALALVDSETQATAVSTAQAVRLGANNLNGSGSGYLDGDIYSVFAIQAALTDAEIAAVAAYFSS
jgi:hypothetical protein